MKIRRKINLTLLGIFSVSIVVFAAAVGFASMRVIEQQTFQRISDLNTAASSQINIFLSGRKDAALAFSSSVVFREFLSTASTSPFYKTQYNRAIIRLQDSVTEHIKEIFLLDSSGKVVASSFLMRESEDFSGSPVFAEGKKDVYLKGVLKGGGDEILHVVSAPLKDTVTGKFFGVVVYTYSLSYLTLAIEGSISQTETGESFLVDKEKSLLTHSRFLGKPGASIPKIDTENVSDCFVGKNDNGVLKDYVDYRGVHVIATHSYVPSVDWCLVTKIDRSEVLAPSNYVVIFLCTAVLLSLLLVVLLSLAVSKKMTGGLTLLQEGIKTIENGNLDFQIKAWSKDEFADISSSFNKMTASLKDSRLNIEKKVWQQTLDLVEKEKILETQKKALSNLLEDFTAQANDLTKFKLALDNVSDWVVITDPEGVVLYGNKGIERISGYSAADAVGKKAAALWKLPMPKEYYEHLWHTIKDEKKTFTGQIKNRRKNGEVYDAEISITPVLDQENKVLFFVGVERDITEAKRSLETAQKFAAIVESTREAIFSKTIDGVITSWNSGAQKMYGYTEAEMVGQKIDKLVPSEKQEEVRDVLLRVAKGETIVNLQTIRRKKDGTVFEVLLNVSPLKDVNGKIYAAAILCHDVSVQKQLERSKTEFVSLASHQLRTPLSSINWYAEMLLGGDAGVMNEDQTKFLKEIYGSSQRMVALINSLLNISRVELGTLSVTPETLDVNEISRSVLSELRVMTDKKHQQILEHYGEIPVITGDAKMVRVVFQNLLSNAVKYTQDEGTISVSTKVVDGKTVFIEVSDNGYGIPIDQQDQIFMKFFRADNAREKDTDGSGLGLYLVKVILEQIGGSILFKSEPEKGTIFIVSFPIDSMAKEKTGKILS